MTHSEKEAPAKLLSADDFDPIVRKVFLRPPPPSLRDNRGDVDRLLDTLAKHEGIGTPRVSLPMVRKISECLQRSRFQVTLTLSRPDGEVIDVEEGERTGACYGLAVDLGSTNLVFYLLDLENGRLLARWSDENPQVRYGEDILSRIHHCEHPGGLEELQRLVVDTLNRNIDDRLQVHGIPREHLYALAVSGNTTMIHFLLGLVPQRICREPYTPVINRPEIYGARSLGLVSHENALLYVLPNVGSYVGGDVLAGVLVSGMHREETLSVLVDVGTNAEIVLGNRDWLMVAAGAAGPALEGGVVQCGMRASEGAVEKIRIDGDSLRAEVATIGGAPPKGVCGSGLVDLLAELFLKHVIDERGRIVARGDSVVEAEGEKGYRIVPAHESATGSAIVITERDINNLIRTKGAMYTALTVIARHAGISFDDLKHFYVAGTFGATLDPQMAVTIGMVPDIPLEKYETLNNSSGTGACLCLMSNRKRKELEEISRRITYVELNVDGDFMSLLSAAMFLPHTNTALFPSVSRRLP